MPYRLSDEVPAHPPCGRARVLLLATCLSCFAVAVCAASPIDEHVQTVTRTVLGIMGYTRWPNESEEIRLCLIGATEYTTGLEQSAGMLIGGRRLDVTRIRSEQVKTSKCDTYYVSSMDPQSWRSLIQDEANQPLLTITEDRALCRIGAMFCLGSQNSGPGFEVNLDSIARSSLRISPKVLHLARPKTTQ